GSSERTVPPDGAHMTVVAKPAWANSTHRTGDHVVHERQIVINGGPYDEWSATGSGPPMVQIERRDQLDAAGETCSVGRVEVYVEVPGRSLNVVELRGLTDALAQAVDLAREPDEPAGTDDGR